jgi:hypothetical protein
MNFNDALNQAADLAKARLSALQEDVFLVRDLNGRIRVLLASPEPGARTKKTFEDALKGLAQDVVSALGTYAYPRKELFLFRCEIASLSLPTSADTPVLCEDAGFKVCLHDRLLMGAEWSASPPAGTPPTKRFTLFSMKGGVGRSTTAAVLSWHLARKAKATGDGHRVLVFDLDLESPGVGTTLLGPSLPKFGIVDWFVEDALGEGTKILPDMVAESRLQDGTSGRIAVVPAFGTETKEYLAKLGRAYLERGPNGREPWPERLKRLVAELEARETPDVVLLDSRTGLHDTSAAAVLAMGADTLLFAADTRQTWAAYEFLFQHWKRHPNVRAFRTRLWMLGSMVPRENTLTYVDGLRDQAYNLFLESVYDKVPAGQAPPPDAVDFAATAEEGNHYPRTILRDEGLTSFDPIQQWQDAPVQASYGAFLDWFDKVLLTQRGTP